MSKHHHRSKAEQIDNRLHSTALLQQVDMSYQSRRPMKSEDIEKKATADDSSIQLRAYQIYHEKGGTALDNWLEAERVLLKR